MKPRARSWPGFILPVLLLIVWQGWAMTLASSNRGPSPVGVVREAIALVLSLDLPIATAQSLARVLLGFLVAAVLGICVRLLMGAFPSGRRNLDPLVEMFRPIAAIAIVPMAILWFGTGTPAAAFVVAYAVFFPLVLNTIHGVASADRRLIDAARTLGVSRARILRVVILPASLPYIFVGARLAMGVAWAAIIAAELAVGAKAGGGGSGGLGQMMFVDYSHSVDLSGNVVCMIMVGLVSLLIDRGFRLVERRAVAWQTR
jgi:ABC-type nitrate/sulfonate/bicarbonate transport system permease component